MTKLLWCIIYEQCTAWIPAAVYPNEIGTGMTKLILNFCNKKKADFGQPF
jgi:hypothetical protein